LVGREEQSLEPMGKGLPERHHPTEEREAQEGVFFGQHPDRFFMDYYLAPFFPHRYGQVLPAAHHHSFDHRLAPVLEIALHPPSPFWPVKEKQSLASALSSRVLRSLFALAQAFLEFIYLTAGIDDPLFTGEERVTFGADFYPDLFLRRSGLEGLPTGAYRGGLVVFRMDIFLQDGSPLLANGHLIIACDPGNCKVNTAQAIDFANPVFRMAQNSISTVDWGSWPPEAFLFKARKSLRKGPHRKKGNR